MPIPSSPGVKIQIARRPPSPDDFEVGFNDDDTCSSLECDCEDNVKLSQLMLPLWRNHQLQQAEYLSSKVIS